MYCIQVNYTNLRDDTKRMVFLDRSAADTAKQTLLHSTFEPHNRNFRRGLRDALVWSLGQEPSAYQLNVYGNLAGTDPREYDAIYKREIRHRSR